MSRTLAVAAFVACAFRLASASQEPRSFDILQGIEAVTLTEARDFEKAAIVPSGGFSVAGEGILLVQSERNIYDMKGKEWVSKVDLQEISSFDVTPNGIVAVAGDTLGTVDEGGFKGNLKLPAKGMRVLAGSDPDVVYLHGGRAIYRLKFTGEYEKIVEADGPIGAMTEGADRVLFSVAEKLYTVKGREVPSLIYAVPSGAAIESIAYDSDSKIATFSTADGVYALAGNQAILLAGNGLSGHLRARNEALWVFDAKRKQVVVLLGLRETLVKRASSPPRPARERPPAKPLGGFKD